MSAHLLEYLSAPESRNTPTGQIVVADPERDMADLIDHWLKPDGFHVIGVTTGVEAIHAAQSTCPDLIILEERLPDLTALDVCHSLNRSPEFRRIPRIMMTTGSWEIDLGETCVAGINQFVFKPFHKAELRQRIERLLNVAPISHHFGVDDLDALEPVVAA